MRNLILFFLVVILMFGVVDWNVMSSPAPIDVQETDISKYVKLLNGIGIYSINYNDDFFPDIPITRGEVCQLASRLTGFGDEKHFDDVEFNDVDSTHEFFTGISNMVGMGIVHGFTDKSFRPDEAITYEQIIKILVTILGYDVYAEIEGGYPAGYIYAASKTNLLRGVETNIGNVITNAVAAKLIYNALSIEIIQQTSFGNNNQFKTENGKTLMSEKLKIEKRKARITANSDTTLNGYSSIADGSVEIGGIVYKTANQRVLKDSNDLLGQTVTAYIKKDEYVEQGILLFVESSEDDNIVVNADDIVVSSKTNFEYNNNGKTEKLNVFEQANIIYNGRAVGSLDSPLVTEDMLNPNSGYIRFISSKINKLYDIIIISSYSTYVTELANKNIISDKYGHPDINIDDNRSLKYRILKNGEFVEPYMLMEWDVLNIATSQDSSLINIIVTTQSIKGTIKEISDNGSKLILSGKEYKISDSYPNLDQEYTLKIGDSGIFYLNADNRIAAFKSDKNDADGYAYLVKTGTNGGVDNSIIFRLFTQNKGFVNYNCAKKVTLDGTPLSPQQVVQSFMVNNKFQDQPIIYTLNSKDEINSIQTLQKVYSGKFEITSVSPTRINRLYKFSAETKVFSIPEDINLERGFRMVEASQNILGEKIGNVYETDDFFNTKLIVVKDSSFTSGIDQTPATIMWDSDMILVDKISRVLVQLSDGDTQIVQKVSGFKLTAVAGGVTYTEIEAVNDTILSSVKKGDFILFALTNKRISKIEFIVKADTMAFTNLTNVNRDNGFGLFDIPAGKKEWLFILGDVERIDSKQVRVNGGSVGTFIFDKGGTVLLYDDSKDKIMKVTANEIKNGDKIMAHDHRTKSRLFIIYR